MLFRSMLFLLYSARSIQRTFHSALCVLSAFHSVLPTLRIFTQCIPLNAQRATSYRHSPRILRPTYPTRPFTVWFHYICPPAHPKPVHPLTPRTLQNRALYNPLLRNSSYSKPYRIEMSHSTTRYFASATIRAYTELQEIPPESEYRRIVAIQNHAFPNKNVPLCSRAWYYKEAHPLLHCQVHRL